MNKDYLLEKAGSDTEIEGLENLLAAYRFEPGRLPMLPTKTPEVRRPWFRWLTFSFAAGAAAVAVFAGLLAYGRIEKLLLNVDGPAISENVTSVLADRSNSINMAPAATGSEIVITDPGSSRKTQPAPQRVANKRPRATTRTLARATPPVTLTKKEKYAYDQLMVALYITGTKLKVVQDTIDRVDDKKDERADNEK
ncbi:MAG TPA: hypothetical protein VGJ02_10850 [Pyrinomonadaceae bacterium]